MVKVTRGILSCPGNYDERRHVDERRREGFCAICGQPVDIEWDDDAGEWFALPHERPAASLLHEWRQSVMDWFTTRLPVSAEGQREGE